MKRFLLLLVVVLTPCVTVYGQGAALTFDALVHSLLAATGAEQAIAWAQSLANDVMQLENTYQQIKLMEENAERAIQNLKSLQDVDSWEDFMDFYNRQLYLERKTNQAFDNINVKIGKKQYHITELESMAYGFNESYVEYWDNEFTEEQRRAMWLELGMTPSNYAYVQPFREKARQLTKANLTAAGIQNEWYMRNMEANNKRKEKLLADATESKKDKDSQNPKFILGSKEIMMMILESLLDTNKVMNDMALDQAIVREQQGINDLLKQAPDAVPDMSQWTGNEFSEF